MKIILFLTALLVGCGYAETPTFTQEPPAKAPFQVEMPGGLSGTYVACNSDLNCQRKCVGICKDQGYWIAEYMSSTTPSHEQTGIVIVCGKAPSQQYHNLR